ncbi:NAD(P)/FAD-dependent oxidoreductase [Natrinema hispanicum]|uniref:Phytoene dehydrogenase-related protein n=1 Tax=Natrinema hispanicum TaxID=392421 RepID=A0A1G6S5M7_9EURY|nr:NAD(P)/FAD-dependent oxidoreductase [Natrinema hispanicum]SDD11981.1 Phytoene dehydrogenase-related protein [Natrinema hispanicum]SET88171.1 Phytoene dehydrogenase-related protein [Natrinema hispanicum]
MASPPHVLVAGGGLAGLVAARHLAGGGVDVTLLERRETVGGRVRTVERDGYRFDRGFQVLFTAYPAVQRELDLEALGLRRFAPGATIAGPDGRSTLADPLREPGTIPATLSNQSVSVGDALRIARLWWNLRRTDPERILEEGTDETIRAYLDERGFSARFVDEFVAPFYGGITLDRSLSTSSRVFEYTFRTLAAGEIAVPAAGMGAIPRQLADRVREVGGTIETGVSAESVTATGGNSSGSDGPVRVETDTGTVEADAVVVATDPPTARELTGVDAIPTEARGCVTQYYALPPGVDLETDRRLLLNATETGPNHVVPHSAVAPTYAPDGTTLISATYLGGEGHRPSRQSGASRGAAERDAELTERTRSTLESWYPDYGFDGLETLHTERVPFAQFVQPPGFRERLPDVRDPAGAVYLAGDYMRWSSIQGAMESGRQAAKAVIDDLSGSRGR